ncbi:unnamed protein product [Darwinula stevensoni]|uniref:MD-2-related lipid-recognition domain-containing protein n=1 Tax=Darwinula stevensoni TaxID=69355 RepID=A0A7R8X9X5_9CRUS|nr:unnamed protein product [Darwinula stevensoni]CAG0890053.1 unnamed protein product [Darwinula stevensoni]
MKTLIILCFCMTTVFATEGWVDCGGSSLDNQLDISGCPRVPCQVEPGDRITITGSGIAGVYSRTLAPLVLITLAGIELDITEELGLDLDACNGLITGDCPIEVGESVVYTATGTLFDLPGLSGELNVTMIIAGDAGRDDPVSCGVVLFEFI